MEVKKRGRGRRGTETEISNHKLSQTALIINDLSWLSKFWTIGPFGFDLVGVRKR